MPELRSGGAPASSHRSTLSQRHPEGRRQGVDGALRPGGHLAFWSATHVFPDDGHPFFQEIQGVYDELGEGLPAGHSWPRPDGLEERRSEIDESGLFEVVDIRQFDWETIYDAECYIELLGSFSGHIAMEAWKRNRLDTEIRARLRRRADPRLRVIGELRSTSPVEGAE